MTRSFLAIVAMFALVAGGCKDKAAKSTAGTSTVTPSKNGTGEPSAKTAQNPALSATKNKLVGTWVANENGIETQLEFAADGAYSVKQRRNG